MYKKLNFIIIAILVSSFVISSCKKDEDDGEAGNPPAIPMVSTAVHVYADYFYVNWIGVTGAQAYYVDVATDQDFNNILPDYTNKEVEINGMFIVEGVTPGSTYYVRMRSYNANGSSGNSSFKEFHTRARNVLPNMDMEDWITYPNYESPSPERVWTSANKTTDLNPAYYPAVLFKTEDAHSGAYAAKGVTALVDGLPLLTGSLSTGVFNVDLNNPLKSMITGVPYKSKPLRFQGYYKYMGVDGDSCEIRTTLSKWNPETKHRDKVGEAIYRTTELVEDYTFFDFEIIYFLTEEPDTILNFPVQILSFDKMSP